MNSFFVELNEFETVLVAGPDAAKFLQGQLTCDVHSLPNNGLTYGAACNNKGRIFAAFVLARQGADFYVMLAHGLAGPFIANLKKFIPFYKCSMQVVSGLQSIGLSGVETGKTLEKLLLQIPAPQSRLEVSGIALYNLLPDSTQFILIANKDTYPTLRSNINSIMPEASYEQWDLANIFSGHFPFSTQDVDKYTPQELHLDDTGYVSFTKGCYTGQEIIARMHYRGKVKKRLYLLQIANLSKHENGIEIIDDSGNKLGSAIKQIVDDQTQTLVAIASLPVGLSIENLYTKEGQNITYRPLTPDASLDS